MRNRRSSPKLEAKSTAEQGRKITPGFARPPTGFPAVENLGHDVLRDLHGHPPACHEGSERQSKINRGTRPARRHNQPIHDYPFPRLG